MQRRAFLQILSVIVSGAGMLCAQALAADAFPGKPVRILVGFSPGGSNDIVARLIAPKLAEGLGQQVMVENRPGAGGNIAVSALLSAPADGHTLLMCTTGTLSIQPHLVKSMPFDPEKDLVAVTQIIGAPYMLMVNARLPVSTVQELVAYARNKPGELNFASSGAGTGSHLAGEMLKSRTGIDIVHIAYKGTGQAMADVLAGAVSMIFDQPVSSMQYARAGKLRALAVAGPKRLAAFPEVPTVMEAGIAEFEPVTWSGICAARSTPPAAIERIQREIAKVLAMPGISRRLVQDGLEPVGSTPARFHEFLVADKRAWGQVIKSTDLKPE
ncbi:Bug family tripartite tricarboxylate transporter substrate binding protein [Verminephrobacter eiseniae]|uniref:Bug family tripartite tricarboxylate transporter substrate binding protein n=1 Tax=Verminephrobacter eiseniae TaxID=364317 RepID=UPI002236F09C|nr:tripartite tricarboxylate transporter substrate binding protein [Verminephrobacter eiseniae]MCW5238396.1 tripartite tricarboxylate transporter substrate binding protein [Verminephrobacter eiseniae]